jgi:hypothetical protein
MSGTTFDSITKTTSSASPRAQVILGDPTGCESYEYDATSLLHRLAPVAPPLPQADKVPPEKKRETRGSNLRRAGLCRRDFLQAPTRGKI